MYINLIMPLNNYKVEYSITIYSYNLFAILLKGDPMKRIISIFILVLFLPTALTLTGCLDNPTSNIKGYVVNAHTEYVRVDIYRQSNIEHEETQVEESVRVMTGESIKIWLPPGTYDIKAYDNSDNFIGSVEFRLPPNAEDFYISVFINKVTARYN